MHRRFGKSALLYFQLTKPARHRAAPGHHAAGDDPRRGGAAVAGAHRRGARRWRARRRWRQHHQLLDRTRSRPGRCGAPRTARSRASRCRPRARSSSGSCSKSPRSRCSGARSTCCRRCSRSSATLFYVFVYTIWLKPRSPQNIVIGGAAGAVPVLVGWAAVTGEVAAPAWVLFAIVFFWTPPHFWALSLRYFDDYKAAGIPMLPVAKGVDVALREILVYSVVVFATTLVLPFVADTGRDLSGLGHPPRAPAPRARACNWCATAHRSARSSSSPCRTSTSPRCSPPLPSTPSSAPSDVGAPPSRRARLVVAADRSCRGRGHRGGDGGRRHRERRRPVGLGAARGRRRRTRRWSARSRPTSRSRDSTAAPCASPTSAASRWC